MVSLGCPKNLVDSEIMMERLDGRGYQATPRPDDAQVIIVNTCAFVRSAKEESVQTVLDLARYKDEGDCKLLVVTGCLSQRYRADLPAEMPEVDVWIGTDEFPRIDEILGKTLDGGRVLAFTDDRIDYERVLERRVSTPKHWAYLKISEGCNHTCKFCIIPTIRGGFRSRSMESIVEEAGRLAGRGARELVLIAQDITDYGRDLYRRRALGDLLNRLSEVPGIEWLRIMYAYPTSLDDHAISVIADNPKVCKYIDMPLQHASGPVLRAMSRPGDRASYRDLMGRLRARVPDIALRTTFIVGYPGETEKDFEELLGFMEEVRFDRVGVFTYSKEDGTPAASLPRQVPHGVKQRRFKRAYQLQQRISHEANARRIGQTVRVLIDQAVPGADGPLAEEAGRRSGADSEAGIGPSIVKFPRGARYLGRTEADAPEIDGTVFVMGRDATVGAFHQVRITGAHPYDLVGTIEPVPAIAAR
jgi:ribosomal protein S12 methylthiotransferase